MKKLQTVLGVILGGLIVLTLGATGSGLARHARVSPAGPAASGVVVGTFDSRAVAVAYIRSTHAREYLRTQKEGLDLLLERARAEGDRDLEHDLEALGPAMQERFHRQGFGTAPVDQILARIADRLPAIASEAGVGVIVSKWNLVHSDPAAELVDVTDRLVAEFQPDEDTLRSIRELVQSEPVPHEALMDHH